MHNIILLQQMKWLGGKIVYFHPWGLRSIPTNDMGCGQWWDVD